MKRIMFVPVLLATVFGAKAAGDDAGDAKGVLWGVRASFDINIPGDWHIPGGESVNMFDNGYGGSLGAVCNIALGRGFYLEPGVSLFYDTYRYDMVVMGDGMEQTNPSLFKCGVRVPVVAGYDISITDRFMMTVFTGPELNYAFAGKVNLDKGIDDDADELDLFKGQRRVDLAWKVGVGFPMRDWQVNINAAFGLTDLHRNDVSFRENRVSVSLAYYF